MVQEAVQGCNYLIILVAVEDIPKGAEVFASYNFPLEAVEGSPGWYRRQYEAVVAKGLGHLLPPRDQCISYRNP